MSANPGEAQSVVTPNTGEPGQAFQLNLIGVKPNETITFEIDSAKTRYRGASHRASGDSSQSAGV